MNLLCLTRVTLDSLLQLTSVCPWPPNARSNWNLEMLVFEERGKPKYPEKNISSRDRKDKNQQRTQPTYDAESGNRTRTALVGGECSHHYVISAPKSRRQRHRKPYLCYFAIIPIRSTFTMWPNYPVIEQVGTAFKFRQRMKN